MEYESKDCDEQKPGAERAGNTSHDGQDYMLGMLCLVFDGGEDKSLSQQISKTALKSDDAPHIFSCWLVRMASRLVQRDLPGNLMNHRY